MGSKYLRYIDLGEVCQLLPTASQGRLDELEVASIPAQFAGDLMWRIERLAEISIPGVLLRPPLDDIRTDEEWNSDLAYSNEEWATEDLGMLIDYCLDQVWEYLRLALMRQCELSREDHRRACSELRIYGAVSEFFSQIFNPEPRDYWVLTALLVYQYDMLFGLIRDGLLDDALYVLDDIAEIRCELAQRDVKDWSENWQEMRKTQEAKARAEIRHKESNQQKGAALAEWEEHGANVSSMAAFARARHKEFGVTERTLYGWIRDHRKANA